MSKKFIYHTPKNYTPKQGDLIWCNFDPAIGREIQKMRPSLVVSSNEYHERTGFCIICPITSKNKSNFIPLGENYKIKGYINPLQIKGIDFINPLRKVKKIEDCHISEFGLVIQVINSIFNFGELVSE